jgi:UDP-N-acetylglucosamine--N-acetylmuramyl-(pentapeptide) pyrophosphoryl-undecaprenol N-acetylglucosamine transferase
MLKGGFVGVPVGLAAAVRKIPFLTHDSDALPGLANRLVGRWARVHAVALPEDEYRYPRSHTRQVGVIVEPHFQPVDEQQQKAFKEQIGVSVDGQLLLITGGSSGAQRINEAVTKIVAKLLQDYPGLHIVHQAGKGKTGVYGGFVHPRLQVLEFMRPMYAYTGAADVVVTRASANTLAELGQQGKAAIVVASRYLAGGHQLKNADLLEAAGAALTLAEGKTALDAVELNSYIRRLLDDAMLRQKFSKRLQEVTISGAAEKIAVLLLGLAE